MNRVAAALVSIAAACALAGCGGGATSVDPVAHAAQKTWAAGSARVAYTARVQVAGQSVAMQGSGVFDSQTQSGKITMTVPKVGTIDEVMEGTVIYLRMPKLKLPGGKPWMKLDLAKADKSLGLDQFMQSQTSNPLQPLQQLQASGSTEKVGTEQVAGVATTHYHAIVDLRKAPDRLPESQRAAARKGVEKLIKLMGTAKLPVDVWIDGDGMVRRESLAYPMKVPQPMTMRMTIDLHDFGVHADVQPPPAGDVFDATDVAAQQIQQAGG
jgi:hypothetical protein